MYRLTLTRADGTVLVDQTVERMPRHWKSWLMQLTPYGTLLQGCTFDRQVVA